MRQKVTIWERFWKKKNEPGEWKFNHYEDLWSGLNIPTPNAGQVWKNSIWRKQYGYKVNTFKNTKYLKGVIPKIV